MVVIFAVLTVVAFVTIDYFVQKRKNIGFVGQPKSASMPLSQIFNLVPGGIFLQPSFTWSKIMDNGELLVGINPILLGIVGQPDEIVLQPDSGTIKKGETLFEISKGGKRLHIKSPFEGEITRLNNAMLEDANWENVSQNWVYKMKVPNINQEISGWLIADKAKTWLKEKYQQVKEFFMQNLPQPELGPVLADGGDIPTGILSQFDEATWQKFENEFIK